MILSIEEMKNMMGKIPSSYRWGLASGGFDCLHPGHVSYLQEASRRCDNLIVIVNGDAFLTKKKGKPFMPCKDRCFIVNSLSGVNYVVPFDASNPNDMTVCEALEYLRPHLFLKGGDRCDKFTIPEWEVCERNHIMVQTEVGASKEWSSSDYLKEWVSFRKGV
jgi:cytidyltransferase-like protein